MRTRVETAAATVLAPREDRFRRDRGELGCRRKLAPLSETRCAPDVLWHIVSARSRTALRGMACRSAYRRSRDLAIVPRIDADRRMPSRWGRARRDAVLGAERGLARDHSEGPRRTWIPQS